MAILDSRDNCPLAASVALIRERDGAGVVVHLVRLDERQEPLFAAPGVIIAVTYAAQHLDSDVVAAFGDRKVIILKVSSGPWARPEQGPAGLGRSPQHEHRR